MSTANAVSILVLSSSSSTKGTKYIAYIAKDTTLAELRKVLESDGIMKAEDKFIDKNSSHLGKSGEENVKWASVLKDDQVVVIKDGAPEKTENVKIPAHLQAPGDYKDAYAKADIPTGIDEDAAKAKKDLIPSGGGDEGPRGVYKLTEAEKTLLIRYAGIGEGIGAQSNDGPSKTGQLVLDIKESDLQFISAELGKEEVIITTSARASAYAKSGWAELALSAESPWASGSMKASIQASSSETSSSSILHVTGRYCFPMCQVSTPYKVKPHPSFKEAVDAALAMPEDKHTAELTRVFDYFGHFYATSLEMGGMKHVTTEKETSADVSASTIKAGMQLAIGAKYGIYSGEASAAGGVSEASKVAFQKSVESMSWDTIGGITTIDDITKWKASLRDSANWRPTRVVSVAPTSGVFDLVTQNKIKQAMPEPPVKMAFHRMYNKTDDFYTTSDAEVFNCTAGGWYSQGIAAFVNISQVANSVPFHRLCNGIEHFYTTKASERSMAEQRGYKYEGLACYVFEKQEKDTVPFYRLFNDIDHLYTRLDSERKTLMAAGWRDEGIVCYVYAAQ